MFKNKRADGWRGFFLYFPKKEIFGVIFMLFSHQKEKGGGEVNSTGFEKIKHVND